MKHVKVLAMVLALVVLTSLLYVVIMSCSSSKSPVKAPDNESCEDGMSTVAVDATKDGDAASTLSSINTFLGFEHYTAEAQHWYPILNDTAYYRDVLFAGRTYISNPEDGETWSASVTMPDGTTKNWSDIVFRSVSGEDSNCFISYVPYWRLCNATSIWVQWQVTSQCRPTGTWHMRFFNNGVQFAEDSFVVLPQVDPAYLTPMNQFNYPDHLDSLCWWPGPDFKKCDSVHTNPVSIADCGCYLTSVCMVLKYHGCNVDPSTLNTWLKNNSGYDTTGYPMPEVIALFAQQQGDSVFYVGESVGGSMLKNICAKGPQVARISPLSLLHWVTVTGEDPPRSTYLINDPWGGVAGKLTDNYDSTVLGVDVFEGREYQFKDDQSGIKLKFYCPIELFVTDPEGRVTGLDPSTGITYNDIPNSSYLDRRHESPDGVTTVPPVTWLGIGRPVLGDYEVTVTGTDSGSYNLLIECYATDGKSAGPTWAACEVPVEQGEVQRLVVNFDKTPGSIPVIAGDFGGGRHRPRDVDRFLSYVKPTQSVTSLPSGTTTYQMFIVYGQTILPQTFKAVLNDEDVSDLFSPDAGGYEIVPLPVQQGQNLLVLSIKGESDGRMMSDEDELTFMVQ